MPGNMSCRIVSKMRNIFSCRVFPGARLLCAGVFLASVGAPAFAGKVVLRIRAGNPIEKPQTVSIKSYLPQGVGTNDIISLDGLQLGYDVKKDAYFVHGELQLGRKEIAVKRIEIKDVWVIPGEELDALGEWAGVLLDKLKGSDHQESAQELKQEIDGRLDEIRQEQDANAIDVVVKAVQHVRAYDVNMERLKRLKLDIGHLENLVLATGQDPGKLIGDAKGAPEPVRDVDIPPEEYKIAVFRIVARNTSPNEKRKVPVRSELPVEIKPSDILDPGGLDVGKDARTGACYVFKSDVEIEAGETVVFNVKIRDKWNVNMHRVAPLRADAETILAKVVAKGSYRSIEDILKGALADLEKVEKERRPEVLGPEYVAFFRRQAERIDRIEEKINRIRAALRPPEKSTKLGFKAKPPSMKSTWMIIYIILGFLALVSLLFFLRWFGKSQAEQLGGTREGE